MTTARSRCARPDLRPRRTRRRDDVDLRALSIAHGAGFHELLRRQCHRELRAGVSQSLRRAWRRAGRDLRRALFRAPCWRIAGLGWSPKAPAPHAAPSYILALSHSALCCSSPTSPIAAFFILNAFCILCAITYVAVVGITIVAWRAPRLALADLPGRASRDLAAAARNPVALLIALVLVVGTVVAAKGFPEGNTAAVTAPTVATLPVVSDAERAKLAQWWEMQPKEILPIDGGGAKVVVVKFNDYQCPLCGLTYNAYKPVLRSHAGAVQRRDEALSARDRVQPRGQRRQHFAACEAAAAVIMARAKGTAEKMEDWLFSHQGPPMLTPDQVKRRGARRGRQSPTSTRSI